MPQPDDTLTLVADGQRLTGWESVSVTRGIEIMPSSFEISLTEKYPGQAADIVVKPSDPCVVLIGNYPVVTGYINRYLPAIVPRQHSVRNPRLRQVRSPLRRRPPPTRVVVPCRLEIDRCTHESAGINRVP